MRYITRAVEPILEQYLKGFPALFLTGPRQSGKTTTLKHLFPQFRYICFDEVGIRESVLEDPKGFVWSIKEESVILDESQYVPEIFDYIKVLIDENPERNGRFILSGSNQFSLFSRISQSLAGRVGVAYLLPMDFTEIPEDYRDKHIIKGGYPKIVKEKGNNWYRWFDSYIQTYIEKDIRSFLKVENLSTFKRFISLLSLNAGREVNFSNLARDAGVSVKTVQHWLSILEASFVVFLIPGYFSNLKKRVIKRPKLYFYDTGLLCYLLGIELEKDFDRHPFKGAVFENYIVSETKKIIVHLGKNVQMFYYRDDAGVEVDLLMIYKDRLGLVEVKLSHTPKAEFVRPLNKLERVLLETKLPFEIKKMAVYTGESVRLGVAFLNYNEFLERELLKFISAG